MQGKLWRSRFFSVSFFSPGDIDKQSHYATFDTVPVPRALYMQPSFFAEFYCFWSTRSQIMSPCVSFSLEYIINVNTLGAVCEISFNTLLDFTHYSNTGDHLMFQGHNIILTKIYKLAVICIVKNLYSRVFGNSENDDPNATKIIKITIKIWCVLQIGIVKNIVFILPFCCIRLKLF